MKYMQTLYVMLDPRQNANYKISEHLPHLSVHQPKNLSEIINLSELLMNNNKAVHRRGSIFAACILIIYSLQAIYICVQVIVFAEDYSSLFGGIEFIAISFFDLSVVLYYIVLIIYYGAEANSIDSHIRDLLHGIGKECIEAKTLCDQGLVFKKKKGAVKLNVLAMLTKSKDTDEGDDIHIIHKVYKN